MTSTSSGNCPTDAELKLYSESSNPALEHFKILRHVGSCGVCTEKIIKLKTEEEIVPPRPTSEIEQKTIELRSWLNDQVILEPVVIHKCTFDPPIQLYHGQKLTITFTLEDLCLNGSDGSLDTTGGSTTPS